jgi:sulfate transport system permease protein
VAGLALTALFAPNGWLGAPLPAAFGWKVAFTPAGRGRRLIFVACPSSCAPSSPCCATSREAEEAAATLGATGCRPGAASSCRRCCRRLLAGFAWLRPRGRRVRQRHLHRRQHADGQRDRPMLIVIRLEQFDYAGAAAVGLAMLLLSFVILLALNLLQRRGRG